MSSCHETTEHSSCHHDKGKDYFFIVLLVSGFLFYFGHLLHLKIVLFSISFDHFFHSFFNIMNKMSWGILLGIIFVGILGKIPREYVISILGRPGKFSSLLRATWTGLLLDLCSHGILMVGLKLYERGASTAQVMAFLIASPWNSLSLTIILFTLIGAGWTLLFIFLSTVIALLSGIIFDLLERKGIIPANPNLVNIPHDFKLSESIKRDIKQYQFSFKSLFQLFISGIKDSKMIINWLIFGGLLSSIVQTFVAQEVLQQYFGPSLFGLGMTLVVTTFLEICSEGSSPLAADLLHKAAAPGNAFTFLMAGVSTDYTEILSIRSTTKSWKIALLLPLVTVPQVLILGYILNQS